MKLVIMDFTSSRVIIEKDSQVFRTENLVQFGKDTEQSKEDVAFVVANDTNQIIDWYIEKKYGVRAHNTEYMYNCQGCKDIEIEYL